jgi:hypothetical protein
MAGVGHPELPCSNGYIRTQTGSKESGGEGELERGYLSVIYGEDSATDDDMQLHGGGFALVKKIVGSLAGPWAQGPRVHAPGTRPKLHGQPDGSVPRFPTRRNFPVLGATVRP